MAALTESELPQTGRAFRWRLASDEALARAAAAGAEGAFEEIFSRYQPALVRHCRAILLDPDEAQDAAQNALTSALRALRRGTSEPVSLKAWLYRIAHNEAVSMARRRADQRARRAPGDGSEVELLSVAGPADDDTRERLQELVVDLKELPERQRNALLLRELSGLGYDEVAEVLGTSAGAARQTVFEARAALVDFGAGRDDACEGVRRMLSDGDRRVRRGRRVGAHLRGCGGCSAFAAQIDARERDLALAFPMGPALALFGGGAGAAGLAGAGAVAGGGWSLGLGSSVAVKCATLCAAAVALGTVAIDKGPVAAATRGARAPLQMAAAPPKPHHHAAIVLHAAPAARAHVAQHVAVPHKAAPVHFVRQAHVVRSSRHAETAHLPAATATAQHSQASMGEASAPLPSPPAAPATATATVAVPTAAPAGHATYTIDAIAQHAVAAAQQIAGNALQQGLALAQQMMARAMTGTFGRHDGSDSANTPDSSSSSDTP